jgi:hypothetical protein
MKVITGSHISFDADSAEIFEGYKIIDIPDDKFEEWADNTTWDWITPEYTGLVFLTKRVNLSELFNERTV